MAYPIKSPKKLIEVALPLDAINAAAAKEKSIRHGHPSTLHLWWARRPLAAARAVIFAQLVNDPGYQQGGGFKYGKNKKEAAIERKRLFKIIEDLVKWENTTNEEVLEAARTEIRRSWREVCDLNKDHPQAAELFNPDKLPGLHDPFAGGGAIPLEAQRLGLEAFASDLNPVAVLINKAMIEIPPKFAGRPPVGPLPKGGQVSNQTWPGTTGLAEDVRRYGRWMREEAQRRIGNLYPSIKITNEIAHGRPDLQALVGQTLTAIVWLWARTVRSPHPAFHHVYVPLISSFELSSKTGHEFYVEPVTKDDRYSFVVRMGKCPEEFINGTKLSRGANFRCLLSGSPIEPSYIKEQASGGQLGSRMIAIVADGEGSRVFLSPTPEHESATTTSLPDWTPNLDFVHNSRHMTPWVYGLSNFASFFTPRQLVTLSTLGTLVAEARDKIRSDAKRSNILPDDRPLEIGGVGTNAYAEAVSTYLALAASKATMFVNTLSRWRIGESKTAPAFGRQAIAMVWDFADVNPFAGAGGDFDGIIEGNARALSGFDSRIAGHAVQLDAQTQTLSSGKIVSTDPPYYDNVPYADLSDYFYVWLRRTVSSVFPSVFATISVPKQDELVADPFRHGNKEKAESFFLGGMTKAMTAITLLSHPEPPITIYYAFKQSDSETQMDRTSSTGWETFLEAVCRAGMQISGTWPMRTENATRMRGMDSNALASSIVLVCRKRSDQAPQVSRRDFLRELNTVLPEALDEMTKGAGDDRSPVAPVDLSQAIIGPGMAVFSKYAAVLEANGEPMTVRTALQLINRFLAEDDFEHDTQFCLHWFEQYGWEPGAFGEADVLARAKATGVDGLAEAGVIHSGGGKVRLLRPSEYPADWDPRTDKRMPIWEALHQLIRSLRQRGESGAGEVLGAIKSKSEAIRQLAYRMYTLCERRGFAEDARAYNELVTSWSGIEAVAGQVPEQEEQLTLFGEKK